MHYYSKLYVFLNLTLNYRLLTFNKNTVGHFHHVKIGRSRPFKSKAKPEENKPNPKSINPGLDSMQISLKEMQNTEGCNGNINYELDQNAAKFGDSGNSYISHYMKDLFWKNDFTIEFEMRTFYNNGLLFLAPVSSSICCRTS